MLRLLFNRKRLREPMKLGRWGIHNDFKQVDFSNHDHCGSKICERYFVKREKQRNSFAAIDKETLYLYPFTK